MPEPSLLDGLLALLYRVLGGPDRLPFVLGGSVVAAMQFGAYWGLVRLFHLDRRRSTWLSLTRVGVGGLLFWALTTGVALADPKSVPAPIIPLLVSAPLAWAIASRWDPDRRRTRLAAWVFGGTLASVLVNLLLYGRLLLQPVGGVMC